jgi:hypothetical protein
VPESPRMDAQDWVTAGIAVLSIVVTALTALFAMRIQARSHREQLDTQVRISRDELATKEREARAIARYDAALRVSERIMNLLVAMDQVRFSLGAPGRVGDVDEETSTAAYAQFRAAVPTLVAEIRLARMFPLSEEAQRCLRRVDAAVSGLPSEKHTFHELSEGRRRLDDAFDGFLDAVGRMAPASATAPDL